MAETVLVQLNTNLTPVHVYLYDDTEESARIINADQQSSQIETAQQVILLLSSSWVYLTQSQVPSRSSEVLKQSIPFSIEDELTNEVEANDYAWYSHSEKLHSVAVISIEKRRALYRWIKYQGISVKAIYSEIALCPAKSDCLSIWCEQDRALVRFGKESSLVCGSHQLPELVQAFGGNLSKVWCNEVLDFMPQSLKTLPPLTISDCCSYVVNQPPEPNLFKPELLHESVQNSHKSNRLAVFLALAVLLSWILISGYQAYQLSAQVDELKNSQQQLLTDAFGALSETEKNDPFAALKSRLKQFSQKNRSQRNSLLDGLYFLGGTRQKVPKITLKSLRLFDNQLEIQINAPSIAVINQFQQQLQNLALEYNVNIGVNESNDGLYQSILTMKPR